MIASDIVEINLVWTHLRSIRYLEVRAACGKALSARLHVSLNGTVSLSAGGKTPSSFPTLFISFGLF